MFLTQSRIGSATRPHKKTLNGGIRNEFMCEKLELPSVEVKMRRISCDVFHVQ